MLPGRARPRRQDPEGVTGRTALASVRDRGSTAAFFSWANNKSLPAAVAASESEISVQQRLLERCGSIPVLHPRYVARHLTTVRGEGIRSVDRGPLAQGLNDA